MPSKQPATGNETKYAAPVTGIVGHGTSALSSSSGARRTGGAPQNDVRQIARAVASRGERRRTVYRIIWF